MGEPEAAGNDAMSDGVERVAVVCATCATAYPKGMLTKCPKDGDTLEKGGRRLFHPLIGRMLAGRYRVLYELGRGSMAIVFGAEHTAIGRAVALKVLDARMSLRPDVVPRFQREARASSRIESVHVVRQLDFGAAEDGVLYLAMELIEGPTLAAELRAHGAMAWKEAARIGRDIALALIAAHASGVVHRDLKPDNVALAGSKRVVKVLDFGIAKIVEPDDDDGAPSSARSGQKLTAVGAIVGTPGYMSPEAIAHEAIGPRSDLYALGAVLFELCTGRPPFVEPARAAMMAHHLTTPAPRLSDVAPERAIPEALDVLVASMLAKKPDDRPADAVAVAESLSTLIGERMPNVLDRASLPPEGEAEASTRPTRRMDVEEMPEEVRPTLKLDADAPRTPPKDIQEQIPTVSRGTRKRPSIGAWLISIGLTAVLVLSGALLWRYASRDRAGPPAGDDARASSVELTNGSAGARIEPNAHARHVDRATTTTPHDTTLAADAGAGDRAADVAPRVRSTGSRASGSVKAPPVKRGSPPRRPGGGLDIVRDYP